MTEEQLREAKPGDRLLIHVEVLRQHPETYGVELATVHPEDGHYISGAFYAYKEAPAIILESWSKQEEPYYACCYTGEHGTFWAVEHMNGGRVATFFKNYIPDAQIEAIKLRDKMNHLFNSQKDEKSNG